MRSGDMQLREIARDVYACLQPDRGWGWSNAGFVAGGGGLMVDTFMDVPRTRRALALFAERAPVSREFGDRRDLGLKLSKAFEYVGYTAGVWNGAGQNNIDNNEGKELGLRLELYPIEGLLIGGVIYSTVGQRDGGAQ